MAKIRVTVTLDESLIEGATASVLEGRSESVSVLVSEALEARLENDARLRDLRAAVKAYEVEHGDITSEEMAELERRDRLAAESVGGGRHKAG